MSNSIGKKISFWTLVKGSITIPTLQREDVYKRQQKIREDLDYIFFHVERINKLSKLLTKADIAILKEHTKTDIAEYTITAMLKIKGGKNNEEK